LGSRAGDQQLERIKLLDAELVLQIPILGMKLAEVIAAFD